jgi:hypothetical protein
MRHHQQAQEHLGRRAVAAMHQPQPLALRQVAAHLLIQVVVVEEVVQLDQRWIGLVGQVGHPGEHIFRRIAVDEHTGASMVSAIGPSLDLPTYASIRTNPARTASQLHR